ncbi:MAG: adenylate/guanylate cyclase domain-containing protein [Polaromonas sp.]|uniref:adenylate/guanylate cyclase domain-containing protein n=1 Tax=Polaromonas sp. TaxID=1869339 RepID=UPI002733B6BB|nr:adenylate/guanylate cyclase domain-containing protein [Polaromonas sp.]MDP3247843.1 adenylate/guanylate cyclase domain-containing protein [Polaromonas sp.]
MIELPANLTRNTKVLLVMDVVESVRIMEQDQDGFVRRWQQLVEEAEQNVLPLHGGRIVKSLGDGLMLEFASAQGCVKAAFDLHSFTRQANRGVRPEHQMHLRMGGHLASFVTDQHDIYGTDVNLTSRVSTLAGPGETVVTADMRDQLAPVLDADVEDLGECHLKHVKEPVRAYRVGPPGDAPIVPPGNAVELNLRPTIAVIPFAMRSNEPGHELLGEALADEVIAALSRTSELHVISRLSTTVFRERQEAIKDIRTHLGSTYILSGTCRSAGTQLALFVELIEAKTGHILWADSLKGQLNGLFSADDELITRLVASISSSVMLQQLQQARSQALPTLEGYTLLLGAVALMHRNSPSDFERARHMLEHLIDRSRRHPLPHAWLAQWHVLRVQQGWSTDPTQETRLALDCTKRALDSEPDCALALTAEGFVYTNLLHQLDTGFLRYEQALNINPNDSLAWLLQGTLHAFKDEGEAAMAGTERALKLSPLDPLRYFYDSLAATAALSAHDYARASELARRSLRANRSHTSTLRAMIVAEAHLGRTHLAAQAVHELLRLEPGFTVRGFLDRSPSNWSAFGQRCAQALRIAGVPE